MSALEALDRLTYDAAQYAGSDGVSARVLRDREEVVIALNAALTLPEVRCSCPTCPTMTCMNRWAATRQPGVQAIINVDITQQPVIREALGEETL